MIKTTTWQRDSHGLFDYEGKDTDRKQLKAQGTCKSPIPSILHANSNRVVSLMRNNVQLELKYDEDGGGLDESKEEETPLQQLAKVIEKNGI
jgi:hypothetical protein